jgi:hypothetical protein
MAKEWSNKDRYHPSHGVPEPRIPLPRSKAVVRSVPAWGDVSSRSRRGFLERAVRPARMGGQASPAQRPAVRPAWLRGQTGPLKDRLGELERGGSEWESIKIILKGDENSNKMNTASKTRL